MSAKSSQAHRVAVIGGDGIGPEVTTEALKVVKAAGIDLETTSFDLGGARYLRDGEVLSDATLAELRKFDAILLGAVGTPAVPPGVIERGLLLKMRFELDLYINQRPFAGVAPGHTKSHDFVVIRENTEGPYVGEGGVLRKGTPFEVATQGSVNTAHGVERCVRYAFELAAQRDRKHLTLVHKTNVLTFAGDLWQRTFNKVAEDFPCPVYAKVEYFNPGHSVKDRMALQMIEDAEARGDIKPGGTIIECTSGNTGMGLALAAIVKGYKLICTLSDKQSKEKMDILRAMGAEVYVCPTNVAPEHPDSYYSVASRLNKEIPNSFYPYQYDNLSNRQAHYDSTGPEIWEQTEGKVTHFVVGVGTGGTISGVGKYLKEKNPNVKVWGVDSYGSVFKKYHETGEFDEKEIYSYITEGIGEDILPKNVDFDVIDFFEKVTDKDGALATRELARKEGLFLGYSCGSAFQGLRQLKDRLTPEDVVVVLFHDHGSRYVGKVYNDDWMRDRGFLAPANKLAKDLIDNHSHLPLVTVSPTEPLSNAARLMKVHDITQIPVMQNGKQVGSIDDHTMLSCMLDHPVNSKLIGDIMGAPYPVVDLTTSIEEVAKMVKSGHRAVLVEVEQGYHIITKQDIITAMS